MPLALYALTESMEPAFRDWQKAWGKEPIVPSGCFLEDGEPFEAWLSKRRALEDPVFAASRGWSPGKDFCLMENPGGPDSCDVKPAHGLDALFIGIRPATSPTARGRILGAGVWPRSAYP